MKMIRETKCLQNKDWLSFVDKYARTWSFRKSDKLSLPQDCDLRSSTAIMYIFCSEFAIKLSQLYINMAKVRIMEVLIQRYFVNDVRGNANSQLFLFL